MYTQCAVFGVSYIVLFSVHEIVAFPTPHSVVSIPLQSTCQLVRVHLEQMSLHAVVGITTFQRIGCLNSVQLKFQRLLQRSHVWTELLTITLIFT